MDESRNPADPRKDEEDERSRRRRLLAIIARIRRRVDQVCGIVDDANSLIDNATKIASDIRSILDSNELRALVPASAEPGLVTSNERLEDIQNWLEEVGDKARVPAEICDQLNEALDLTEAALQGQWGGIADRLIQAIGGRRIALALAGAIVAVLGSVGIWSALNDDGDGPPSTTDAEVFSVFMFGASPTMLVGESQTISVRVEGEGGIDVGDEVEISWNIDDPDVASISDDGTLTALSAGVVEISVQAAGLSDSQTFTIENPTLPDLIVELPNPVFVDCVRGLCTHTITVIVSNVGDTDSGRSDVAVELDGMLTAQALVGALPVGESSEVQLTFDPGDSCYDPDCTAIATVDVADSVEEINEDNNRAAALFGG